MKVLNKSDVSRTIEIKLANGTIDTLTLHRGRPVDLPAGAVVNPSRVKEYLPFLKSDPALITLLDTPAPTPTAPTVAAPTAPAAE